MSSSSSPASHIPDSSPEGGSSSGISNYLSSQNTASSSSGTHSSSNSQASTVPVSNSDPSGGSFEDKDSLTTTNAWGILYPINCNLYKVLHMENNDPYYAGRDSDCQYQFRAEHGFKESAELKVLFSNISKKHFKIYKENDDSSSRGYSVILEDLSSNGTFVNGFPVGQGCKYPLDNTARIALAGRDNEAFIFVDVKITLSEQNELPLSFKKKYCLERERLGSGAHGVVRRGRIKSSNTFIALKMIEKKKHSDFTKDVYSEARLMCRLDHQNIVKIHDVFDTENMLYIVLEFVRGGELFNYITTNGHIREDIAKNKFQDLLNAVSYLHDKSIIHRDIKPENILLTTKDIHTCQFKITDFGLSRLVGDESMRTICGTPGYVAPEILAQVGYTGAVDVWSLGCVLYIMLSGSPPFSQKNMEGIKSGNFTFSTPIWTEISDSAKGFITKMLKVSPIERVSIMDAHHSEWFTGGDDTGFVEGEDPCETNVFKRQLSEDSNKSEVSMKRKCGH